LINQSNSSLALKAFGPLQLHSLSLIGDSEFKNRTAVDIKSSRGKTIKYLFFIVSYFKS
tara:strand:- start:288 stop:464 length:177 start_codon:yes stop_codon:yes gene_type:complete